MIEIDWSAINYDISSEELDHCCAELGRAIFAFSTLEIQVAHALSAALGTSKLMHGEALLATVDAVNKQKLLDGLGGIFLNPKAGGEELVPNPALAERLKKLARLFQSLLAQRNVMAHGTFAKHGDRMLMASMQLSARLKPDGGSSSWVWMDELPDYHSRCQEALTRANELRVDFLKAHQEVG